MRFELMHRFRNDSLANCWFNHSPNSLYFGGSGEIRTHGPFRIDSFQDCCHKPDSTTLPQFGRTCWNRTVTLFRVEQLSKLLSDHHFYLPITGTPSQIRTESQQILNLSALPISVTGHINFWYP